MTEYGLDLLPHILVDVHHGKNQIGHILVFIFAYIKTITVRTFIKNVTNTSFIRITNTACREVISVIDYEVTSLSTSKNG